MKKILFILLLTTPFVGFGQGLTSEMLSRSKSQQAIIGSGWKIYEEDGNTKIILFEGDGTFTHMQSGFKVYCDDDDTWKIDGNKIVLLYNNGFQILSGTINKEMDYMSGTSINRKGYSESWYGKLIKF